MKNLYLNIVLLISFLFLNTITSAQNFKYGDNWQSIGPNIAPIHKSGRPDAGIGPVEYIRVYQKKSNHLFAGSLSGGLFYSDDAGENWINSGSDKWAYSASPWADFFPADENIWFGCSNYAGNNGKPGIIGKKGGIYRTKSKGEKWRLIGDYSDFGGYPNVTIYGTRFHPDDPNTIFVLTSRGLYVADNCLENAVNWRKVRLIDGIIYDLDFFNGKMYVSNFYHDNWNVFSCPKNDLGKLEKVSAIGKEKRKIRNLTFEPAGEKLLIAFDFSKDGDELYEFNPANKELKLVLSKQKISFGSGHTFAVSPFDSNELFFGYGTRVRKWDIAAGVKKKMSGRYHVDIEFVVYDPMDSLVVYLASHGGVFKTIDGGKTWESKSAGLGISEVMGLAVSATDVNQVAIGCFHDGSMLLADFNKSGNYLWKTVNGGDGLLPLIHPDSANIVFTSNQFNGGGLSFSDDTCRFNVNMHSINGLKTSGWEMAAFINYSQPNITYFNFMENEGDNKGNINVCRSENRAQKGNAVKISDFKQSHGLKSYKVYGLFGSKYHPNELIAYVLDYTTDKAGKKRIVHRLYRTQDANASSNVVINSWHELEHPNNNWIGDVEIDGFHSEKIYMSYVTGKENPESIFGDRGLFYALKYSKKSPFKKRREFDITQNIPISLGGRYNIAYDKKGGGRIFVATRKGVFYGDYKQLKGKRRWKKVGKGLPHCKVYGIDYQQSSGILTVGLFGRGVWRYYLQ